MKDKKMTAYKVLNVIIPVLIILTLFLMFMGGVYWIAAESMNDIYFARRVLLSSGVIILINTVLGIARLVLRRKLVKAGWRKKGFKWVYDPDNLFFNTKAREEAFGKAKAGMQQAKNNANEAINNMKEAYRR